MCIDDIVLNNQSAAKLATIVDNNYSRAHQHKLENLSIDSLVITKDEVFQSIGN